MALEISFGVRRKPKIAEHDPISVQLDSNLLIIHFLFAAAFTTAPTPTLTSMTTCCCCVEGKQIIEWMLLILNGNPFTSRQRKLKKFLVRDKIRLFNERNLWSLENFYERCRHSDLRNAPKSNFWSRKAQFFSEHCAWNVFRKMITITSKALFRSRWHLTCFRALTVAVWVWGEKWQIESPDRDEDRIINDWSVRNVPVYWLNFRSNFKRLSKQLFRNLFNELTF